MTAATSMRRASALWCRVLGQHVALTPSERRSISDTLRVRTSGASAPPPPTPAPQVRVAPPDTRTRLRS